MYKWTTAALPILALLVLAVVTFPTPAPAHSYHVYEVSVTGAVAVTDPNGANVPFTTDGNHKGTRFGPGGPVTAPVILTFAVGSGLPTEHPAFACLVEFDGRLDGVEWKFRVMTIQKGEVGITFRITVSCDLGGKFGSNDTIYLNILFTDPAKNQGPGTYTSTNAHISLSHLGEESLDQPGPPSTTHDGHEPFFSGSGFTMTVTVVDKS